MLGLRRGGLISAREVEAGIVELGFEVAVLVEPDDGVGDGLGAVEGAVEGRRRCGSRGGGAAAG